MCDYCYDGYIEPGEDMLVEVFKAEQIKIGEILVGIEAVEVYITNHGDKNGYSLGFERRFTNDRMSQAIETYSMNIKYCPFCGRKL